MSEYRKGVLALVSIFALLPSAIVLLWAWKDGALAGMEQRCPGTVVVLADMNTVPSCDVVPGQVIVAERASATQCVAAGGIHDSRSSTCFGLDF